MRELVDKRLMLEDVKSWVAMDSYEQHLINNMSEWIENLPTVEVSDEVSDGDCISRQAAIDAMKDALDPHIVQFVKAKMAIEALPSAQPELTDEQSIAHLQSSGWMQRHDREIYESGLKERLADDSESYDSLIPHEDDWDTISRQAAIDAINNHFGFNTEEEYGSAVQEVINGLPSAQPELIEEVAYIRGFEQGRTQGMLSAVQPDPCVNTIDALNESIKHFDDMAEECQRNANIERNDYMDMRDDAAEYRQLSIWLNELKWLRERFQSQPEIIRCKDCKHWIRQTNCQGAPLSFGSCESEDMWASLYGEITEVEDIDADENHYCGYAERRTDE